MKNITTIILLIMVIEFMSSCEKEYIEPVAIPVLDTINLVPITYRFSSIDSNSESIKREMRIMGDYKLKELPFETYELIPIIDTIFATGDWDTTIYVPVIHNSVLTKHKYAVAGVAEWISTDSTYSHTTVEIFTEYSDGTHFGGSCVDDGREVLRTRNGSLDPRTFKYFKVPRE